RTGPDTTRPRPQVSGPNCAHYPQERRRGRDRDVRDPRHRLVVRPLTTRKIWWTAGIEERVMAYEVDFTTVSTVGLESSPVAAALAGLRANEARYFKNKYDHVFTVEPAGEAEEIIERV